MSVFSIQCGSSLECIAGYCDAPEAETKGRVPGSGSPPPPLPPSPPSLNKYAKKTNATRGRLVERLVVQIGKKKVRSEWFTVQTQKLSCVEPDYTKERYAYDIFLV